MTTTLRKKAWFAILCVGFACATYTLVETFANLFQREVWVPITAGDYAKDCRP